MKKSKFRIETLLFSIAMAASLLMPLSMNGQGGKTDGFFSSYDGQENRSDDLDAGISNDSFGAPLGSGLWIMLASGVAYGVAKRKKSKVALGSIVVFISASLLSGFTQCKKKDYGLNHEDAESVSIRVELPSNSKVDVDVLTGAVNFEDGDELLVANDGVYAGSLYYTSDAFTGSITPKSTSDYLHFYYCGNVRMESPTSLKVGSTQAVSFLIKDQIDKLPVVSYGHSTALYHGADTYSAKLMNKCALVKFNVTTASASAATLLFDVYDEVSIDFSKKDASDAYTCDAVNQCISLTPGSGERWAVMLPQEENPYVGGNGTLKSGRYRGVRPKMPKIESDSHLTEGVSLEVTEAYKPSTAIGGLFTVDENGSQVYFGSGNFISTCNSYMWNFFAQSYMTMVTENTTVNTNCVGLSEISLMGWGTTMYDDGATIYLPNITSTDDSSYNPYGSLSTNLYDNNGHADWGYVPGQGSGFGNKQWRTLKAEEWEYIFCRREDAENKYSYATVVDMPGLLILPDSWTAPTGFTFTPGITDNYTTNVYNSSIWKKMKKNGAVFLPCEGVRVGTNITGVMEEAYYWSSSRCDDNKAYAVRIGLNEFSAKIPLERSTGAAVRLVCD